MNAPVPTLLAHPDPATVDRRPLVTLVLPCFNEAGVLRAHYDEIAAYLKTTKHLELVYNTKCPRQSKTVARLHAWSDAAYLTHKDSKSHTGLLLPR